MPFAWTPPGRVFVGIDLERTALLGEDGVQEGRGRWGGEALSHATFRSTKGTDDPLAPLPDRMCAASWGRAAVRRSRSLVTADPSWSRRDGACRRRLALRGVAGGDARRSRASGRTPRSRSRWTTPPHGARATWSGAMVQGTGAIHVLDDLGSGAKTARALATSIDPEAGALVRITPARLVWWKGWSSGSLAVA